MKFGRGIYFDGRKVLSWVSTLYPDTLDQGGPNQMWGASTASNVRLGENFIKQKLEGRPACVGGGGSCFLASNPDLEGLF